MKLISSLVILLTITMSFEAQAWDEFEASGVDVSTWLYDNSSEISEWSEFTKLQHSRGGALIIKEKTLKSHKTIVAVTQKVVNTTNIPYCLFADLKDKKNAINTFVNGGETLIMPGEEKFIGGYRIKKLGRNWKVRWSFKGRTNLSRCN
ncbi:hypothetical protein A9Q84_16835 [Halobacteriovorax marinus]|uniref:Uncharacterized protein n=1 Tax=Halobacteriovorax marinus TaxID=97084 RepID=A0A1Y5F4I8_9BACT|nr:hypothetical protein A9Q84_16835 [Halobacteriovorax marinus]